jgi:LysM repeat protein
LELCYNAIVEQGETRALYVRGNTESLTTMVLYLLGILLALAIAALLWQQRKSSNNWQRQFTFFVDLLALSATALIVGVLAMVQLATPVTTDATGDPIVVAPANATVPPLPNPDSEETLPNGNPMPEGGGIRPTLAAEPTDEAGEETDATETPVVEATTAVTPTVAVSATVAISATESVTATIEPTATPETESPTATIAPTEAAPDATPTNTRVASATPRTGATPRTTPTPRATATPPATATAAPTATPQPSPTVGTQTYTVQAGDTLSEIAAQFGVSTAALTAANPGINPDSLQIDDVLTIPAPGSTPPVQPPAVPTTQNYTIQEGDNFSRIAARLGIPVAELERLNPGLDPTRLRVGQVIQIPR